MNDEVENVYTFNDVYIPPEKKGLYEKEQKRVVCPGCNKHIVDIKTVDDQNIFLKHIIVCPYCGEESFIVKTEGSYIYECANDDIVPMDIVYEKKDLVKLYLGKRNAR